MPDIVYPAIFIVFTVGLLIFGLIESTLAAKSHRGKEKNEDH